jgi:hypothetical protein
MHTLEVTAEREDTFYSSMHAISDSRADEKLFYSSMHTLEVTAEREDTRWSLIAS